MTNPPTPASERASLIQRLTSPLRAVLTKSEIDLEKARSEVAAQEELLRRFLELKDCLQTAEERHAGFVRQFDEFVGASAEEVAAKEAVLRLQCQSFDQWMLNCVSRLARRDVLRRHRDVVVAAHRRATIERVQGEIDSIMKAHGPLLKKLGAL